MYFHNASVQVIEADLFFVDDLTRLVSHMALLAGSQDQAASPDISPIGRSACWPGSSMASRSHRPTARPTNPLMDRIVARFRGEDGEFIPKGAIAARCAIEALRRGNLGLLADQKMNDGIPVPFFARLAMTAPALAVLALRFDRDVLPLRIERLDGAHFRVTVFPPLPVPRSGEPHADTAVLMGQVNATLEAWIRDRPEQWLWVHHRWPD
jgi:lauroyl/myristoyl acyltransferase